MRCSSILNLLYFIMFRRPFSMGIVSHPTRNVIPSWKIGPMAQSLFGRPRHLLNSNCHLSFPYVGYRVTQLIYSRRGSAPTQGQLTVPSISCTGISAVQRHSNLGDHVILLLSSLTSMEPSDLVLTVVKM